MNYQKYKDVKKENEKNIKKYNKKSNTNEFIIQEKQEEEQRTALSRPKSISVLNENGFMNIPDSKELKSPGSKSIGIPTSPNKDIVYQTPEIEQALSQSSLDVDNEHNQFTYSISDLVDKSLQNVSIMKTQKSSFIKFN